MVKRRDIAKPKPLQIRHFQRPRGGDVPERISPSIAVFGRIGQGANAHAIENDPNYPRESLQIHASENRPTLSQQDAPQMRPTRVTELP